MTTEIVATPTDERDHKRSLALLKAVGLDRVAPEQRELALAIAKRYDLDLMLKHLVLVDGRPYLTRDGLLHIAHRSGQLDGIETTDPVIVEDFWRSTCTVWRKDMSRGFRYSGRYPTKGGNQKFAPEMAVKVAEVMSLRRAFDVSAPAVDERWDADVPVAEPEPAKSLAEKVAEKAAQVTERTEDGFAATVTDRSSMPPSPPADPETGEVLAGEQAAKATDLPMPEPAPKLERCPSVPVEDGLGLTEQCAREKGHGGPHKSREGSWPQDAA